MKTAFITGFTGQDGTYLARRLIYDGYTVYGLVRSTVNHLRNWELANAWHGQSPSPHIVHGDIIDGERLRKLFAEIQPDEIYHLAAQSHVKKSYESPLLTLNVNGLGTLNVLEAMKQSCPNAKLYLAETSEMFGNCHDEDGFQRITTPMHPVSPYGASKVLAHNLAEQYRHMGYQVYSGILFNHESPLRGEEFVTTKIVKQSVEIKKGKRDKLVLGNTSARRDWGYALDYCKGMTQIMQQEPGTYILATGISHSVQDVVDITFKHLSLPTECLVANDPSLYRDEEILDLKGDASVMLAAGWQPKKKFEDIIAEMIRFWNTQI